MVQAVSNHETVTQWVTVCKLSDIKPNTGVCALLNDEQVAIFRVGESDRLYALSNYDPFSKAYVLSRGLVGDRQGIIKVAAPIYKQNINLETGEYLDEPSIKIPTYSVRVVDGEVQLATIA
ncbi:MAG: nitrite reductase small subunit NirD [Xenococcaceae cyanobacterium MO_188.B32]|nr:nitrite reductase small subunit NirD [Xenococcaceae cyanobacterium MO_188.B32]